MGLREDGSRVAVAAAVAAAGGPALFDEAEQRFPNSAAARNAALARDQLAAALERAAAKGPGAAEAFGRRDAADDEKGCAVA